ncbi:MAG TPA: farnesyl diphosphate synthase [Geminicoccaceae bacterium]|nr:farnesyl diphosphate synthase [Geminicoccaceae bacterium]
MGELRARMAAVAEEVEAALDRILPRVQGPAARLHDAMRYATLGGGKRLRPFLVVASADLFGVPRARSVRVGAAIELIHAYSLVHDDLPAMDDALTRRGRPSCHRQYDEATAILAGDALQSVAFDLLVDPATHSDPEVRCALVSGLAVAAGPRGMCGGQMLDLLAEGRALDLEQILELQRLKTGALIGYACEAGALLGGGSAAARAALRGYAADLGLAFQIQDDLLDVTGDAEITGKDLGRDAAVGKATVVALLGVDGSRRRLEELRSSALAHLDRLEGETGVLRAVFDFVISRSS